MSKKYQRIFYIVMREFLTISTVGWLGSAIWLTSPITEDEAIVTFILLVILTILHFAEIEELDLEEG